MVARAMSLNLTESFKKINRDHLINYFLPYNIHAFYDEPANWTMPDNSVVKGHYVDGQVVASETPRLSLRLPEGMEEHVAAQLLEEMPAAEYSEDEKIAIDVEKANQEFEDKVVAVLIKRGLLS